MFLDATIRRTRPRRTIDHLFGDDTDVTEAMTRLRTVTRPEAEFDPYEGRIRDSPIAGDSAAPIARAIPRVPAPVFDPVLVPPPLNRPPIEEEPPVPLSYRPQQPRDYLAEDIAYRRKRETDPVPRSRLKSLGVGLLRGGIPGAIAGVFQPKLYGEMERDRDLDRVNKRINEETLRRRADTLDDFTRSQIEENKAQAEAYRRPAKPEGDWFPEDTNKDGIPDTEVFRPKAIGSTRNVYRKEAPDRQPIFKQVKNADGSETTLQSDDNGKTFRVREELRSAAPPRESDFSGPLAAVKFKEASAYWAQAEQLEKEAKEIVIVVSDSRGGQHIDPAAETRQERLLAQATELKKRTWESQEKGREFEAKSTRPDRPKGQYSGQRFNRTKVAARAKSLGMTVAEAERTITDGGGTLY